MIKNIFMSNEVGINLSRGRLATKKDLEKYLVETGKSIDGYIQLIDGIYTFISPAQQKKILELEGVSDIDEWDFKGEYIKVSNEPCLYNEFRNDIDEEIEEIESCTFGKDALTAVTRMINPNVVYIYNYSRLQDGSIDKKRVMINRYMLIGLFREELHALH